MRRLILHVTILLLTFAIGIYANSLVLRAAYCFIPDYDAQPRHGFFRCAGRAWHDSCHNSNSRFQSSNRCSNCVPWTPSKWSKPDWSTAIRRKL